MDIAKVSAIGIQQAYSNTPGIQQIYKPLMAQRDSVTFGRNKSSNGLVKKGLILGAITLGGFVGFKALRASAATATDTETPHRVSSEILTAFENALAREIRVNSRNIITPKRGIAKLFNQQNTHIASVVIHPFEGNPKTIEIIDEKKNISYLVDYQTGELLRAWELESYDYPYDNWASQKETLATLEQDIATLEKLLPKLTRILRNEKGTGWHTPIEAN